LAAQVNPKIFFEVFIHKVDGLSDEHKRGTARQRMRAAFPVGPAHRGRHAAGCTATITETQRNIQQRATEDLMDNQLDQIQVTYHLTSIYDHSIFEAFSKVIQKLIPQLPTLENLLNVFCAVRAAPRGRRCPSGC